MTKREASSTSRPGSATADFWGGDRHGQNLFANCLLALDVQTGKRLWHFQTIHHDLWDLDNVSAPQLVTVTHNGQKVDVVAHAGKTGFLYVFNRVTGEPLWPIEERPVAQERCARSSCHRRRSRSRQSRRPSRGSPSPRTTSTRTC